MTRSAGYVSADYLRRAAEQARHIKQRSYDLMRLHGGRRVLDVGCGPGVDTVPLAERVGAGGSVVGVDIDAEMLAAADRLAAERSLADRIEHREADVRALPFADAEFDACRAERLFQVLPTAVDPRAVLAELVRVTRHGGRVVLIDTDWGTASVDFSDTALERRLLTFFAERLRPNGYAGQQLPGWCRRQGLADIEVELFAMPQNQLGDTPFGSWLSKEALAAGVAGADEIRCWQDELVARSAAGEFFGAVTIVLVAATRP